MKPGRVERRNIIECLLFDEFHSLDSNEITGLVGMYEPLTLGGRFPVQITKKKKSHSENLTQRSSALSEKPPWLPQENLSRWTMRSLLTKTRC